MQVAYEERIYVDACLGGVLFWRSPETVRGSLLVTCCVAVA